MREGHVDQTPGPRTPGGCTASLHEAHSGVGQRPVLFTVHLGIPQHSAFLFLNPVLLGSLHLRTLHMLPLCPQCSQLGSCTARSTPQRGSSSGLPHRLSCLQATLSHATHWMTVSPF